MSTFKLPLSGDVVQSFSSWTSFLSPVGSQFGLININLGQSSAPKVEEDMLSDVGSYGKQIGRIGDALIVLLTHFHPRTELTPEESTATAHTRAAATPIAVFDMAILPLLAGAPAHSKPSPNGAPRPRVC